MSARRRQEYVCDEDRGLGLPGRFRQVAAWAIALGLLWAGAAGAENTQTLERDCPGTWARVGRGAWTATKAGALGLGKLALFVPKTLEYPFWFLGHLGVEGIRAARSETPGKALLRIPVKILKRDGLSIVIYAAIYAVGKSTFMTLYEMDGIVTKNDPDKEDDVIVYVNGFTAGEENDGMFYDAADEFLNHKVGGKGPKRLRIEPRDLEQMRSMLRDIAKKHGPIKRMEFYGHASNGAIRVGDQHVGEAELAAGGEAEQLRGVFRKGGKVALYTCWTARGENGSKFLETFGQRFLDQGGTVYGSTLTFGGSPTLLTDLAAMPYFAYRGGKDAWEYRGTKPLQKYLTEPRYAVVESPPTPPPKTVAPNFSPSY